MLVAAIILFVFAALFGLYILTFILRDLPTPKLAVLAHGPIAATAIVLVIIALVVHAMLTHVIPGLLLASIILFIIAAIGGFTLLAFDLTDRKIPKTLALLHPLIAVSGLILLIIYAAK